MSEGQDTNGPQPEAEPKLSPMSLKMRELEAERQSDTDRPLPERLPLSDIVRLEELFQPRREAEHHITDLRDAIKRGATLDPLTVLQVGSTVYLVDGHHRWTAYDEEKVAAPVPVVAFRGHRSGSREGEPEDERKGQARDAACRAGRCGLATDHV